MTIYLDIVLLENLGMNYMILFTTGYLLKIHLKHIRLIISALLGGIYSVISYMNILPIYSNLYMKVILSMVMIQIAFSSNTVKKLLKQLVIFYLISFAFGGCAFALLYFLRPENVLIRNGVYIGTYPIKIVILGGIVGAILVYISLKLVKMKIKISKKDMIYKIKIFIEEKNIELKALLDTGNLLKDPINKVPVIVAEKDKFTNFISKEVLDNLEQILGGDKNNLLENIGEEYVKRIRIIPFSSIGKQNGLMLGIKIDKVIIKSIEENEETIVKKNVIVALSEQKLDRNRQYNALIGLDLIDEGSEENEFVTNFKR